MVDERKLRKLIRLAADSPFEVDLVNVIYGQETGESVVVLNELESYGYVERSRVPGLWQVAMRGKVLLSNRMTRFYKVNSMKKTLADFMERVKYANSSGRYTDLVDMVKVTSQYPISEKDTGVHILYSLVQKKISTEEFIEMTEFLIAMNSKHFDNIYERTAYSSIALGEYLKSRSHILKINLVGQEEMSVTEGVIIYKYEFGETTV